LPYPPPTVPAQDLVALGLPFTTTGFLGSPVPRGTRGPAGSLIGGLHHQANGKLQLSETRQRRLADVDTRSLRSRGRWQALGSTLRDPRGPVMRVIQHHARLRAAAAAGAALLLSAAAPAPPQNVCTQLRAVVAAAPTAFASLKGAPQPGFPQAYLALASSASAPEGSEQLPRRRHVLVHDPAGADAARRADMLSERAGAHRSQR
jgi:hypothetical protein